MASTDQLERGIAFKALHEAPPLLVLPNVWEVAGARIFEEAGFKAIGTTSRGIAGSLGFADGEEMSRAAMLQVVANIVSHVSIPVSADMEAGYGDTPEEVARTAEGVIASGAVGINIEDGRNIVGDKQPDQLADLSLQVEKLSAVRQVATELGISLVINARTDVYWLQVGSDESRFDAAVSRANAYREAGADCLFIPGVKDPEIIGALVREIDGPINVLAVKGAPSISDLEQLGVARVSIGSGPMRATLALLKRVAVELRDLGTYRSFTEETIQYGELIESLTKEGERHVDYPTS